MKYEEQFAQAAFAELRLIVAGQKPYLKPDQWRPVAYAAQAPETGVTIDGGPLKVCFERNIQYLNEWFEWKHRYDPVAFKEEAAKAEDGSTVGAENSIGWEKNLPGSSWGRMLGGAAHTLRWGERADMRAIVNAVMAHVLRHQKENGYILPYPEDEMDGVDGAWGDERKNYDRVNLTRGMVAAARVGNPDALPAMRRFYDWLYATPYAAKLLAGPFDGSAMKSNTIVKEGGTAHNCNNGHEGSLLMYFSPLGRDEDLVQVERYFVQDFQIEAARRREPLSLSHYPYHVAHCYVLLAYKAWLDHYRATGHAKYIEGAKGAWDIVHDHFLHVGGSLAICEHLRGSYPPDSNYLRVDNEHHTGENCGSVFWADINHRLLQFHPEETKYADEIEKEIFNCTLHTQDDRGHISYHCHLAGTRQPSQSVNTCCEVMGSPFIAGLPQYIFSVASDGVYVNLFAPATIACPTGTLKMTTGFPFDGKVEIAVAGRMKLRIRIPRWAGRDVPVIVNGKVAATGKPGSFVTLDRVEGTVALELPMTMRTVRYTGLDQHPQHARHALLWGPILMALVGADDLDIPARDLPGKLQPVAGKPLHFTVAGKDGVHFQPYWQIQTQTFTCFPTLR